MKQAPERGCLCPLRWGCRLVVMGGTTSNADFGTRVGCDPTMASRLRNGQRMPSAHLLGRIIDAYDDGSGQFRDALLSATLVGPAAVGQVLRQFIFGEVNAA